MENELRFKDMSMTEKVIAVIMLAAIGGGMLVFWWAFTVLFFCL